MSKRRFSEVLLSLEWSHSADGGRWMNEVGVSRRDRSLDPVSRLTQFLPLLSMNFLSETAAQLGEDPLPRPDEPIPTVSRAYALFLLSVVFCLWKSLKEDGVEADLQNASCRAVTGFYVQLPEDTRDAQGLAVLTEFSQEVSQLPQFFPFLQQLQVAVDAYVLCREKRASAEKDRVVKLGASFLKTFTQPS